MKTLPVPVWAQKSARERPALPKEILGSSKKTEKSKKIGVLSRVVYLAPSTESGRWNMCPHASAACAAACLGHSAGRMHTPDAWNARRRRTWHLMEDRRAFLRQLEDEIARHERKALKKGMIPAVRLNGSSDVAWETISPELFTRFPGVRFYDYTKSEARMDAFLSGRLPSNYHLTFSQDERPTSQAFARAVLEAGGTVAVVFAPALPREWHGFPVIDGDVHDARFQDEPRSVVGLSAKGAARGDSSGFVVRI